MSNLHPLFAEILRSHGMPAKDLCTKAALAATIQQATATGVRYCGDCTFWMTPRCPRESHSNTTGRWSGPASRHVACEQYQDRRPAEPLITRIEFAPGHEDERLTQQDVSAAMLKMNAAGQLFDALVAFEVLWPRDGEDANDTFERVAAVFRRETGFLRPGKDCRMYSPEERESVWNEWLAEKRKAARAAIATAEGRSPQEPA